MRTTTAMLDHPAGYVTDAGMETDLIFHHGVELPEFAAFPLLDDPVGRRLLRQYVAAMRFLGEIADDWRDRVPRITLVGMIGPRGDGYQGSQVRPDEAAAYHLPQVRALARGGAELVTAYTMTGVGEALGVVLAAREVGVPVGIAFTVETDGRLPDGTTLAEAIATVDACCPPEHYGVNCAHPRHIAAGLGGEPAALSRIAVVRANASELSHAELDEAEELHDGDPAGLAEALAELRELLPGLRVIGGCCGTDARHVAAIWAAAEPVGSQW